MRKILGCAHVRKAAVADGDFQNVVVLDGGDHVLLSLSANSYPAKLTGDEAVHIANSLIELGNALRGTQKAGK